MNPDALTAQALLNCLVREVSAPEEQIREANGYVMVRLARSGRLLRLATRRPSGGLGPRLAGDAALRRGNRWDPIGWEGLARLIAGELTLATGTSNEEFVTQVRSSHAAMAAIVAGTVAGGKAAGGTRQAPADLAIDRYLSSEQSLVAGHRFHPAPKARGGDPRDWLPFAPEAGARFPLRFLAVRRDMVSGDGDATGLDRLGAPPAPSGYALLPAHPWQLRLLGRQAWLAPALRDELLIDLGTGPGQVAATSSVRTVYDPAADVFCKFSLNVRITNCVRKNSWYELAGAVVMTRLLGPVFADLAQRFPGSVMLGEPGYRTVSLAADEAVEGLSVIVREGLRGHLAPGVTPVLAAALAEPPGTRPGETAGELLDGRDPEWLLGWWEAYVRAVAPPVLHALFGHGVVLEPHLQNVLVGLDREGLPVQAIFRDMEGTKLLTPDHDGTLKTLEPGIARALAYDADRGWNRVAYCLIVNHLAEIAAAVADRHPGPQDRFEAALWHRAGAVLAGLADDHGWPPRFRAVLTGTPLPAKANLRLRWMRGADRDAAYVTVASPLREHLMARPAVAAPCWARPAVTAGQRDRPALPAAVRELAERLGREPGALPAYVYDLDILARHVAAIRAAMSDQVEVCYAIKANPEPPLLRVIAQHADGLEVASGGELRHAAAAAPGVRLTFGGPGKTSGELTAAISAGTFRFHVESLHELRLLGSAALAAGRFADILLRVNLPGRASAATTAGAVPAGTPAGSAASLVMGGQPSPFGMDPDLLEHCGRWLSEGSPQARQLRLRGIHAHLASGLAAPAVLEAARRVLDFARPWCAVHGVRGPEFNLGGGMAVDYRDPGSLFDWAVLGRGLAAAARPGETLRIEPGRAVTAYCGWYITRVLDVKRSHGKAFAVVAGGTHHLRTPAAKGHDQPFTVLPVAGWPHDWARPAVAAEPVTVVGQLCTPKDVLARDVMVTRLRSADLVAFEMAGAYAWNISHHGFLMHPEPVFHYVGTGGPD